MSFPLPLVYDVCIGAVHLLSFLVLSFLDNHFNTLLVFFILIVVRLLPYSHLYYNCSSIFEKKIYKIYLRKNTVFCVHEPNIKYHMYNRLSLMNQSVYSILRRKYCCTLEYIHSKMLER